MSQPSLLVLNASPRGERSESRKLSHEYIGAWQALHPAGSVIIRELGVNPPPVVSEDWIAGAFTPPEQRSAASAAAIAVSDAYVDELLAATDLLISTPIYNFTTPAALKLWIDQVVRIGRTVALDANGFAGLAGGRKVTVLVSSGGDYRPGTPASGYNFLEPYLRGIFGFLGITAVEFIYAHSQSNEAIRETAFDAAVVATRALAAA